jgi:hypothetical protein
MILAAALIAVALAAQPTESPQPKRITKGESAHSAANADNADQAQQPTQTSNPATAPAPTTTCQPPTKANERDASRKAENIRIQRRIEVFTGILAGVGVLQGVVMFLTWLVYRRQAHEMRRSRHEMRRQRHVMYRQWKAIREQVGEMTAQRGIVGRQLTTMDNQVAEMKDQTETLRQSVAVAKESADAALRGIELQKVAMEQWIVTDNWEAGPIHIPDNAVEVFLPIRFAIANTTKFKMFLNRVEVWIDRRLAIDTYFRGQLLTPDGGSTTVEIQRKLSGMGLDYYRNWFLRFEIGGIVYYVDAFGKEQEQRFGFHCTCRMDQEASFKPIAFIPPDAIEIEQQKRKIANAQQKEAN